LPNPRGAIFDVPSIHCPVFCPFPHPSRVGESISTSGVFSDKHILSMDKMVFTNYQYSLVKNPILAILIIAIIQRPVFYIPFLIIRNPVWQMRCVNFLKQTLESNAHQGVNFHTFLDTIFLKSIMRTSCQVKN
jgi:hypothetical protein